VTATRKSEDIRIVIGIGVEPRAHPIGQVGGIAGRFRQRQKVDAPLAGANRKPSSAKAHRVRLGLEQVGGNRAALGQHHLCRLW
jgi:hypothetical protein